MIFPELNRMEVSGLGWPSTSLGCPSASPSCCSSPSTSTSSRTSLARTTITIEHDGSFQVPKYVPIVLESHCVMVIGGSQEVLKVLLHCPDRLVTKLKPIFDGPLMLFTQKSGGSQEVLKVLLHCPDRLVTKLKPIFDGPLMLFTQILVLSQLITSSNNPFLYVTPKIVFKSLLPKIFWI